MNLFTSLPWDRTTPSPDPEAKLRVAPLNTDHAAGTVLWGCGPTERHMYTSSEPRDPEGDSKDKGFHHAHDVSRGVRLFRFDAEESGDTGTISPDGKLLNLFTHGPIDITLCRTKLCFIHIWREQSASAEAV